MITQEVMIVAELKPESIGGGKTHEATERELRHEDVVANYKMPKTVVCVINTGKYIL